MNIKTENIGNGKRILFDIENGSCYIRVDRGGKVENLDIISCENKGVISAFNKFDSLYNMMII